MTRTTGLLLGLLVLAAAACGTDDAGVGTGATGTATTSPGGAANDEAVAWADKVCQSVRDEVETLSRQPQIDTSSPQTARDGLTAYLNDFGTALDRLIGGIKGAGTPPVADGQQLVDETTRTLEQANQTIEDARTKLDRLPVDDPQAARQAFTEVAQELTQLGELDATQGMEDHPELKDAFDRAATCQELEARSSATPSTSPSS